MCLLFLDTEWSYTIWEEELLEIKVASHIWNHPTERVWHLVAVQTDHHNL